MIKESNQIIQYKFYRDKWLKQGCKQRASYYQILILREIEKSIGFINWKLKLKQHKQVLCEMLREILGIDDINYQMAIYCEVIISLGEERISENTQEWKNYQTFLKKLDKNDYCLGAYQLHINTILEIADTDISAANRYADNILVILKKRYGQWSFEYAKMRLHVIGEYLWFYDENVFRQVVDDEYSYLDKYFFGQDILWCDTIINFTASLVTRDNRYEKWLERCEECVKAFAEDENYNYFKCRIACVKAQKLDKRGQYEKALIILQDAIKKYIAGRKDNLFYASMYHFAAGLCWKEKALPMMEQYAQAGLSICEELGQTGSQLYYHFHNYLGLMCIEKRNWKEAEKIFCKYINEIEDQFGKQSELYGLYEHNLMEVRRNQGKTIDLYIDKDDQIEDLQKQVLENSYTKLLSALAQGKTFHSIDAIYKRCVNAMNEKGYSSYQVKLDTAYYMVRIYHNKLDDETTELSKRLRSVYESDYASHFAIIYWDSLATEIWLQGYPKNALEIYEKIIWNIQREMYESYKTVVIKYIQLLIIDEQYFEATNFISIMLNLMYDWIIDIGFEYTMPCLCVIRILLSMSIFIYLHEKMEEKERRQKTKKLLEDIINCKTIDREIKSLLGRYQNEYIQEELKNYRDAHRRLAALELRHRIQKNKDEVDYQKRKKICVSELVEYGVDLKESIPIAELVQNFQMTQVRFPEDVICVEYFAYFKFVVDRPMYGIDIDEDSSELYDFFAFIINANTEGVREINTHNISTNSTVLQEIDFLLSMSDINLSVNEKKEEIHNVLQHLHRWIAEPVLEHAGKREKIYLGLDFILQMLPMDIIFFPNSRDSKTIILLDSLRYIDTDSQINIGETEALILGVPQFAINGVEESLPLNFGNRECEIIAKMLGGKAYSGKDATQNVLWDANSNIIHISTHGGLLHGDIDRLKENNLFTDSYLQFAGYEDWAKGKRVERYGNGVVSGDDFLFMDLSQTKLIVLSACMSGLGNPRGLDVLHGMRWAIGTAGAENSITTLWEVSDCACALVMVLLYRNLFYLPVGEALHKAKQRLRNLTVDDIRRDKELYYIAKEYIQGEDGKHNPFWHWKYWAGFVYYHR